MAGSYSHIVDKNNKFKGIELIGDLGDAYEALEECWHMIDILSGSDKDKIDQAHYEYLKRVGGNVDYAKNKGGIFKKK